MTDPVAEQVEAVRPPRARRKDWIRMAVLGAATVLVFWLLFRNVPFSRVLHLLRGARPLPLALGILLTASFPLLSAWRWKAVIRSLGVPLGLGEATGFTMACWTLSTFTPSKGSDLAKAYFLRGRAPVSLVLGSVLAERLVDVLTLLAFCFAGAVAHRWNALLLPSGLLLLGGMLAVAGLLLIRLPVPKKLRPKVERLLAAVRAIVSRPTLLLLVLGITAANWLASIVQTWLFYEALGYPVPMGRVVAALPAAIFVGLLPLTVAGMGTRDAALIRLLADSAPEAASLGVGILYSLCGYWIPGLIGLPFLRWAMQSRDGSAPKVPGPARRI